MSTTVGSDDEGLLTLDLPERRAAPAAARKALAAFNGSLGLVSDERLLDAQLLVSELVTNSLVHGGGEDDGVRVIVRARPRALRVEVIDAGEGFDPSTLRLPSSSRRGGRWGLHIVAMLADRRGVDAGGPTAVWFEIDMPQQKRFSRPQLVAAQ